MAWNRPWTAILPRLGSFPKAVLVLALLACGTPTTLLANQAPAAEPAGKPPTDEECRAVAEAIGKAATAGDAAALDEVIDWAAVYESCTSGIDAPEQLRKTFIAGVDQGTSQKKGVSGVSGAIAELVKKGGRYDLLHAHTKEGRPWALFRLIMPDSGASYHDFLLARRPDGKVKVVDMYNFLTGELISQTLRRSYIQVVAQVAGVLVGRMTEVDPRYVQYLKRLGEMNAASQGGKPAEVIAIYKGLPPDSKKERSALILRLAAAQSLGEDNEYLQSIEDCRKAFSNDGCIDLLSIDYYRMKKQYREYFECIDRLDIALGTDPYLQTYRAAVHLEQNDLPAAKADLRKALEEEPGLVEAYWSLISVSLKENDHAATLETLRLIRDRFQIEIGDLNTVPLYKAFIESPQYQEWLKAPARPEKAEGKDAGEMPEG